MNDFLTHVNVNILLLVSYDLLIGMDWIKEHKVVLKCFNKTFTYNDDKGDNTKVKGVPKKVTIREISALEMKRSVRLVVKYFLSI